MIHDVSDYQFRRPNPQIRIVSKLFWDDQGQAEQMYPSPCTGATYVVSTDESGGAGGVGGLAAACARGASPFGYPNIIDITDETNPKIVAKLMLEVSDPPIASCSSMIRRMSAAESRPTTLKDALQTALTIRPCSLAGFKTQACEFSTFAI